MAIHSSKSAGSRIVRVVVSAALLAAMVFAGRAWLDRHPEHDPWAPLSLSDTPGWATKRKLAALRADPAECRAVLRRSDVAFRMLPEAGDGQCRRDDRIALGAALLAPTSPPVTCSVAAAYIYWLEQGVQPAAEEILGSPVATVEHMGAYNCRRIGGGPTGTWSEHATGNAIDIAAFVLKDGSRVSVARDWQDASGKAAFLNVARDAACRAFGTVLSPDYNDAHRDHLHLDQAARGIVGVCR